MFSHRFITIGDCFLVVDLELFQMIVLGLLPQLAQMLIEETPVPGVCYISPVLLEIIIFLLGDGISIVPQVPKCVHAQK